MKHCSICGRVTKRPDSRCRACRDVAIVSKQRIATMCKEFRRSWSDERLLLVSDPVEVKEITVPTFLKKLP